MDIVLPTSTLTFSRTNWANPSAATVTRYSPTGRFVTMKCPSAPLVAVLLIPNCALSTVTLALGTTDSFTSVTKPEIVELICCAFVEDERSRLMTGTRSRQTLKRFAALRRNARFPDIKTPYSAQFCLMYHDSISFVIGWKGLRVSDNTQ